MYFTICQNTKYFYILCLLLRWVGPHRARPVALPPRWAHLLNKKRLKLKESPMLLLLLFFGWGWGDGVCVCDCPWGEISTSVHQWAAKIKRKMLFFQKKERDLNLIKHRKNCEYCPGHSLTVSQPSKSLSL